MNDNASRCATDNESVAIDLLKGNHNIKKMLPQNTRTNQRIAFHNR